MKHIVFDCDGTLVDVSLGQFKLYPGIVDLIEELALENQLYVWTARDRASTLRILQGHGIYKFFSEMATVTDFPSKPHPAGLESMLKGIPKSSICIIGDSATDMVGAQNFEVLGIGAVWNTETNEEYLKSAGADFIVSHPFECSKLIQLNLKGDEDV